jgi:hypothetical protein
MSSILTEFIPIIIGWSFALWLIIGYACYQAFDFVRVLKAELNDIRATIEVRVDELEKRIIAISGANFSKIRRVESQCNLTAAKFEFFDQMFRQYIITTPANPPAHNA